MPATGLVGLAWGDIGFRHMSAKLPLDTVAALQGVKLVPPISLGLRDLVYR